MAFNTSYGGSVEINALERGTDKGSYSGDLRSGSLSYLQRKVAGRRQSDIKAGSAGTTTRSAAEGVYDMDNVETRKPTDEVPAKAHQENEYNNCDRENGNPLADAGIGAKYTNNVEISHGDADSTWSHGSRQMLIHREMGWSVISANASH